ncbi:MAG: hypothetical protein IPO52_05605 [Gemmatimonadetes bacterium]|nr:hypothetical protein [Gemmatimonadota bacterium]
MTRLIAWVRELTMWPMLVKEFIQLSRDRPTIAMMVGVPAIQLMLFGFAIRTEVRNLPTAVYDEAKSSDSRALVRNTGNLRRRHESRRGDGVDESGGPGQLDFTRDLARHHTAKVQVIVDAADPLASQAAMSGAAMGGQQRALELSGAAVACRSVRHQPDDRAHPGSALMTLVIIMGRGASASAARWSSCDARHVTDAGKGGRQEDERRLVRCPLRGATALSGGLMGRIWRSALARGGFLFLRQPAVVSPEAMPEPAQDGPPLTYCRRAPGVGSTRCGPRCRS